jgi:hypothetical protein
MPCFYENISPRFADSTITLQAIVRHEMWPMRRMPKFKQNHIVISFRVQIRWSCFHWRTSWTIYHGLGCVCLLHFVCLSFIISRSFLHYTPEFQAIVVVISSPLTLMVVSALVALTVIISFPWFRLQYSWRQILLGGACFAAKHLIQSLLSAMQNFYKRSST